MKNLAVGRLAVLILSAMMGMAPSAFGQGVTWLDLSLDQALSEAAKAGKMILISVHAHHCGQCQQMSIDVWDTPAGAELAEGMIPIRIDSTAPEGAKLQMRFPVTGLPATIFVSPEGTEVDRISSYENKQKFLSEALPLRDGIDPLPEMEARLKTNPGALPLYMPVLERYLNRMREGDAKALLGRILDLDKDNRAGQAERALAFMARYAAFVKGDKAEAAEYWKSTLDRFPNATTSGAAVKGTVEAAAARGSLAEWTEWLCAILEKEPKNARLQYSAAITAHQYGIHDPRLAKAARAARALGFGSAKLDTIAVELEKAP